MANNLRRFQWQIGNTVLGPNTQYPVVTTQIASYNVNAQDSQIPLSDEVTMGQDTFQAQSVTLTIGVKDNAPMRNFATTLPADLVQKSSKLLDVLQDEWKAMQVKQQWGQYVPLIHCDGYGTVKRIYGRPRKFQYSPKTQTSQFRKVTAEFARMDTFCYNDTESSVELVKGAAPAVYSTGGMADTRFRVLLYGPQTNPLVIVGDNQIQLQHDIAAGVVVEVNGYPWTRRIIDSNNLNLRTTLIGNTKFLDQFVLPKATPLQMSWTAESAGAGSRCLVLWRDAYNVI